ncbi:unnamed protein product [Kluyveromyces dobzhanskii CBS 2104]|uniref:Protein DOM34 homolog n=1 Tax=Kluyveromyces dobzhanskii CBS 2104 TaxID=1427455 RepID=A0A0A8KZ94_9SACH|nr:unnamed protein product [Kluyveromyces dobzhanskii CBS 2104]
MLVVDVAKQKGKAILRLQAKSLNDLKTVYKVVNRGDEIIYSAVTAPSPHDASNQSKTLEKKVRLRIESCHYNPDAGLLKYKGRTVEDDYSGANQDIEIGIKHSFTVRYYCECFFLEGPGFCECAFTLIKPDYNSYVYNIVKGQCEESGHFQMGIVVLQEGVSHMCLINPFCTVVKDVVEHIIPKKTRNTDTVLYNEIVETFYRDMYDSMSKHFDFDVLKSVIICSPGFHAKCLFAKVLEYAKKGNNKSLINNNSKFLVAQCSTGYLQGMHEVLKSPVYGHHVKDTETFKLAFILREFQDHLINDDCKAWYGKKVVAKAAEFGYVDTLLISDKMLFSKNEQKNDRSLELLKDVESSGGKIHIFSSEHYLGDELNCLSGLACILKYPMPDMDEDIEESEVDTEEESENDADNTEDEMEYEYLV